MQVKCVKLNNGEEVIGRVVTGKSNDTTLVLELPAIFRVMQVQGKPQLVMLPFSEAKPEGEFTFRSHAWVCDPYDAGYTIESAYLENTSKIALA